MLNSLTPLNRTKSPTKWGYSGTLLAENGTMAGQNHTKSPSRPCLPAALFAISIGFAISSPSATWTAAGVDRTSVASALTSASSGDTVIIPAGSATWSSGITITKGVTINGAGTNSTQILNSQAL